MAPSEGPRRPGILKAESTEMTASPAGILGLQQTASPKSTPKSVSIAPKGELISPLLLGDSKDCDQLDLDSARSPRKLRVKGASSRRLAGRPPQSSSISSLQQWLDEAGETNDTESNPSQPEHHLFNSGLVGKLAQWLRDEKVKSEARRARRKARHPPAAQPDTTTDATQTRSRRDSDESVDLDTLENILKESFPFSHRASRKLSTSGRHSRPSIRRLHRAGSIAASSDTEYMDSDILVPSAEVILDNSKTLSYKGGAAKSTDDLLLTRELTNNEDAWANFKFEVLRLIHTLRLKGWRRVPLEMSNEISIERLSGALTNAVYVVSPPHEIPESAPAAGEEARPAPRRKPNKLLLRIYGPQVEHLIDRESELQILRRLARKHIGPCMLGTFKNGRFEEFFNAAPLTPEELRNPDTSRHIAKRMRELHDGIDLLDYERQNGPFVWQNWDKWLARVQMIVEWLDGKIKDDQSTQDAKEGFVCGTTWAVFHDTMFKYRKWLEKQCGGSKKLAEELVFAHNDTQYGNILRLLPSTTSPLLLPANSHKQLVVIDFEYSNANTVGLEFANHFSEWTYNYHDPAVPWRCTHTRYPTPEEQERFVRAYVRHRPDFNITTPRMEGLDTVPESRVASPYISPGSSDAADPGAQQQQQQRPDATPLQNPAQSQQQQSRPALTSSISNFMLDARNPNAASPNTLSPSAAAGAHNTGGSGASSGPSPGTGSSDAGSVNNSISSIADANYAAAEEAEVKRLLAQTRLWRMANSAQWVAWGIVQAKIPGMPDFDAVMAERVGGKAGGDAASDTEIEYGGDGRGKENGKVTEGMDGVEKQGHGEGTATAAREGEDDGEVEKVGDGDGEGEEDAEFDYLSYARDRAMLFWGDAVTMGFVKMEQLPADVQRDIKVLEY